MKTWKRLLQTTCVAALVGATAMTVTASASFWTRTWWICLMTA